MNPRYPIMAALLAASLGRLSLGTSHATPQPAAGVDCSRPNAQETVVVNILAFKIACEEPMKTRVGERLGDFVMSRDDRGPRYVAADIADNEGHVRDLRGTVAQWAGRATPAEVAHLYYVVGDANPAPSIASDAALAGRLRPSDAADDWRRSLPAYLADGYERADRTRVAPWRSAAGEGRIARVGFVDDTGLFLAHAAAAARRVIEAGMAERSLNLTQEELRNRVAAGDSPIAVPVGPGAGGVTLAPNPDAELYRRGGVEVPVTGPGGTFNYYLKRETQRDPATGAMTTYVAIYDNNVHPPYIRRVPITQTGENAVTHAPGRWNLVLDITGDPSGNFTMRLRHKSQPAGSGTQTSANALSEALYTQARRLARAEAQRQSGGRAAPDAEATVTIGGQQYYPLIQGSGTNRTVIFLPRELAADTGVAQWMRMLPASVAVIGTKNANGLFEAAPGIKPDMGLINGQPYHLELIDGAWRVREGAGDPPPRPAAAADGPASGGPASPGQLADASGYTLAQDNFSAEARTRGYTLRSAANSNGGTDYLVMTPEGFVPGNQVGFGNVRNFRTFSHYVTWEGADGTARYLDIYLPAELPPANGNPARPYFQTVALFEANALRSLPRLGGAAGDMLWLKDNDVLMDALTNRLRYSESDRAAVMRNLATQVTAPAEYSIGSAIAGNIQITRKSDGAQYIIWPRVEQVQRTAGDNPPAAGAEGSTAVSPASNVDDGPFTAETMLPGNHPATLYDSETGSVGTSDAVIYAKTTTVAAEREWYLVVRYKERLPDESTQSRRSANILVFSGGANRYPAPSADRIGLRGYKDTVVPVGSASFIAARGHTAERGVWCLRTAPVAAATPATRVGPVLWWGMQPEEATRICTNEPL
ncbi:MAG: hypothetical protein SF051_16310 [Elusimicrobiota bacterium]|nr:hypothetical protein [Elusimicrobiota bacterium]